MGNSRSVRTAVMTYHNTEKTLGENGLYLACPEPACPEFIEGVEGRDFLLAPSEAEGRDYCAMPESTYKYDGMWKWNKYHPFINS